MINYIIYGVPFHWKSKLDWLEIYKITEPGHYSLDPETFVNELDDETFREDLENLDFQWNLGEHYVMIRHTATGNFFIVDREYLLYVPAKSCLKMPPSVKMTSYQKLIVFINYHNIKVDYGAIGMYVLSE
jgi:hypothetical protein